MGLEDDETFDVTCANGRTFRAGPMALLPGEPPLQVQIRPSSTLLRIRNADSSRGAQRQEDGFLLEDSDHPPALAE